MRHGDGSHTDFGALRSDEWRDRIGGVAAAVESERGSECAVTVKAGAGVDVKLRRAPRSEGRRAFGADDSSGRRSAIARVDAVGDVVARAVAPESDRRLQPPRPLHLILAIHA